MEKPTTDKPSPIDFTKVFALDSGDSLADSDFYAIAIACTRSHYPPDRYNVISSIRKFIDRNSDYRELIVARFLFGLKIYIEERQKKFDDPINNIKPRLRISDLERVIKNFRIIP